MPDEIQYSQKERLLAIKTTLGETKLLLEKFTGAESLSTPFEFQVTLLSPSETVDLKSLLRTSATVSLTLGDGTQRYFNAVFRSLKQAEEGEGTEQQRQQMGISNPARELIVYKGVLVPKLWFLGLDANCRIFQSMAVKDIVEKILKENSITDYSFRLNGSYQQREYCVQYRESSLNFISRLLEEEGIFYFFEHTSSKHTIVFADKSSILSTCPGQAAASYSYSEEGWIQSGEEGISNLERIENAHSGKAVLTDYSFEKPSLNLKAQLTETNEEVFDYPGKYLELSEGERYVRLRLEEHESDQFVINGSSVCRGFRPGYNFKLKGHYRSDTNQDYFLTSVMHDILDSTYRDDPTASHYYKNKFRCIPKSVPYRPPQTARKPFVQGLQPAVVVGKAGEEIWVDKYGRVKVQFFWDREGKKNENSSCWVRVSQIWAGKNWGWMTIPRIGQEVLVDFLEGDPDRPIIVGRVYNADQMPPYSLPDNQTQAGIKSRSSKGGTSDNFNEIRFEDKKGNEMLTVHAEKDMETKVENNRTINVDGTHTETIIKDTKITITQGNHSLTLNKGNQSVQLDAGNQTTTITMGKSETTAMQSIELKVGANSILINQEGVTIKGAIINIEGDMMTTVKSDGFLILKGVLTEIN